jgi:NADH dehydrogenase
MHPICYLAACLRAGEPVPPFRFLGLRVSLCDYAAFETLTRFGFFDGGFINGHFAQLSHGLLCRRRHLSRQSPVRGAMLRLEERFNPLVRRDIRIS